MSQEQTNTKAPDKTGQTGQEPDGKGKELTQARVEQWVSLTTRPFTKQDACDEIGIATPKGKEHLRKIFTRLEKANIIVPTGNRNEWRCVDAAPQEMNWWDCDPTAELPIKLPFELDLLCKIYPKSIIIVAGEKNAGKTCFLLNCVLENMRGEIPVDFWNSESGPEQLKDRLSPVQIPRNGEGKPIFRTYYRDRDFAAAIHPDHISVIDYLDIDNEFYMIGKEIKDIFLKLNKGVAIIGIQKRPGTDLGVGASFSAKSAVLYISLTAHTLKVKYVKNPRVDGADNRKWGFRISKGIFFDSIHEIEDVKL